jgi:hypothetical protein
MTSKSVIVPAWGLLSHAFQGVEQIKRLLCLKVAIEPASETMCFIKKLDDGQNARKEDYVSKSYLVHTFFIALKLDAIILRCRERR